MNGGAVSTYPPFEQQIIEKSGFTRSISEWEKSLETHPVQNRLMPWQLNQEKAVDIHKPSRSISIS
ncbi:hypothetical protein [Acanthopleuribacter pedis]|uniref:Uncharacterized protein n=1 Tax=Acanthopleuribacter pedis TaxID=442870 RepID=A0A8J7U7V4_9BACT|nr:hypothetical protein [Acanthopleuribacter pedis]MBO1323399.1 hypothetical protein [Acanthopleuribacter pedis]